MEKAAERTVIVDGFRTPFAKEQTDFKNLEADHLGALMVREMLKRFEKWDLPPSVIDRVIGSNVATPPHAANLARVMAVKGGLPLSVPADTLGKNCGSGIAAVHYARLWIESGAADAVLVVGAESMSRIPFFYQPAVADAFRNLAGAKSFSAKFRGLAGLHLKLLRFRHKDYQPLIGLKLGLTDPLCGLIMGLAAEKVAKDPGFKITREEQDAFSLASHKRAFNAMLSGRFKKEIVPVYAPDKNGRHRFALKDNGIRSGLTISDLAKLKPIFDGRHGTVTVGNSSQVTDGAAALLLMSEKRAKLFRLPVLGYVGAYADIGFEPSLMGITPAGAIAKALKMSGLNLGSFDIVEINEAFAAVVLASRKTMDSAVLMKRWFGDCGFGEKLGSIDDENLNPSGGAIALGHPVGVSGLRLVITALNGLKHRNGSRALVSACVGGGQGTALILEREGR